MEGKLIKAAILVSIMTIISKPLGFIREAIIAAYYGATSQTDAFFLAQNMPALLFPAVCMSLSTAFLTMYVSKSIKDGEQEGNEFAYSAILFNIVISSVLSLFAFIFSPIIVKLFAPGFDRETLLLATKLTRIVMSSFMLLMLKYMLSSILNSKEFYIGDQIAGILYNATIIGITILAGNQFGVYGLTWTFIFGYIVQDIVLIYLTGKRFSFKLPKKIITNDTKWMFKIAFPILIGNSVVQLNGIVDKVLASGLESGTVSALSYSTTLNSFVISIIITSLSTVLYPTMTNYIARDNKEKLIESITKSIIMLIIILTPISIITAIYAGDVVRIAYGRGSFGEEAVVLTSSALMFYGLSYMFTGIKEVTTKVFYAYKDTKTPMINSIISVGLNIIFSIILSRFMGVAGIALGTTLATVIATFIFLRSIKRKIPELSFGDFKNTFYKIIISSGVTTISVILFKFISRDLSSLIRFVLVTAIGFTIYIGILYILKCNELQLIIQFVKQRIKGKKESNNQTNLL